MVAQRKGGMKEFLLKFQTSTPIPNSRNLERALTSSAKGLNQNQVANTTTMRCIMVRGSLLSQVTTSKEPQ